MAAQAIMCISSKCLYKLAPSCPNFVHYHCHHLTKFACFWLLFKPNMAFKTKFSFVIIFMVALSFMLMKETHGCNAVSGCFHIRRAPMKIESRKLLAGFNIGVKGSKTTKTNNGEDLLNRELRMVPTGPDPLHHNGGSPKKPRTTP